MDYDKKRFSVFALIFLMGAFILALSTTTLGVSNSQLTLDNDRGMIIGLNEHWMVSVDDGITWTQGTPSMVFAPGVVVLVAEFDQNVIDFTNVDPFCLNTVYLMGDVVAFEGNIYRARWWTQGSAPDATNLWSVWELLGPIEAPDVEIRYTFSFTEWTYDEAQAWLTQEREALRARPKIVGYLPSWGIFGGFDYFTPDLIDYSTVTHLLYSFILINPIGGDWRTYDPELWANAYWEVIVDDPWAFGAAEMNGGWANPNGVWNNVINDIQEHEGRYFKFSLGGWTNSYMGQFTYATNTPEKIENLADQIVDFMLEWNFDGVDIDWEFPRNQTDSEQFIALLRAVRSRLDEASIRDRRYYQLGVATSANPDLVQWLSPTEMINYVDVVNVMTYDFNGAWQAETGHNAPLFDYTGSIHPNFNVHDGLQAYLEQGVPADMILVGIPFYARVWNNVPNIELVPGLPGLGVPGVAPGEFEGRGHGVIPFYEVEMLLQNPDYVRFWDDEAKVPYLFNARTGRFISFDDQESISIKVDYIIENGFGGALVWELSGDTRENLGTSGRSTLGNILRRLID